MRDQHKLVKKTWGREIWIANSPLYCGKELLIHRGKKTSQHFHIKKTETMYVIQGALILHTWVDAEHHREVVLTGESVTLLPGTVHALEAAETKKEDTVIIEISTEHFDSDSYRISR